MQEKQQSDCYVRQPVEADCSRAAARQQAGKDHRAYECESEVVGEKLRAGHRRFAYSGKCMTTSGDHVVRLQKRRTETRGKRRNSLFDRIAIQYANSFK